jgi:BlaI family transcriptional regulator, penicillinase repressor
MPGRKSSTFTEVELEFMQIIWSRGEVSTEDIRTALSENGRDLPDGAIRKIFSILMKKGHVKRRPQGRGFIYSANIHEEQAHKKMILDLLGRAFNDSVSTMLATLLNSSNISGDEMQKIKELIARHEKEVKK